MLEEMHLLLGASMPRIVWGALNPFCPLILIDSSKQLYQGSTIYRYLYT